MKEFMTKLAQNIGDVAKSAKTTSKQHAPEILAGAGIGLMLVSAIEAVVVTFDSAKKLEEKKAKERRELTTKEKVQTVGKNYILPTLGAVTGAACVVGSIDIGAKRYVALSGAYAFVDESFKLYKNKVIETIGEKKARDIQSKVSEERLKQNPQKEGQTIIMGKGDVLAFDSFSGRYFNIKLEDIQKIENQINYELVHFNFISLNSMYTYFDLEPIDVGYELGWSIDVVHQPDLFRFVKDSKLTSDGQPCLVIDYNVAPVTRYNMFE